MEHMNENIELTSNGGEASSQDAPPAVHYTEGQIVVAYRQGDWRSINSEKKNYWHVAKIMAVRVVEESHVEGGVAYDVMLYDTDYSLMEMVDPKHIKPVSHRGASPETPGSIRRH